MTDIQIAVPLDAALRSNLDLQHHLDALQSVIGEGNAKRGFHEEGDRLRSQAQAGAALRNYYVTKLALIGTEVSEAIEELGLKGIPLKPEGVPSELADIVIRAFDFADEAGFSLGEAIIEKLQFNATRGFRHGGKEV